MEITVITIPSINLVFDKWTGSVEQQLGITDIEISVADETEDGYYAIELESTDE
ncbi:UNVERIFIED_CONTAM: hypothetical protein Cloal_2796 [Acetivibrio alkalicellulosi]